MRLNRLILTIMLIAYPSVGRSATVSADFGGRRIAATPDPNLGPRQMPGESDAAFRARQARERLLAQQRANAASPGLMVATRIDPSTSRTWYIMGHPNCGPLLLGMPQRLYKAAQAIGPGDEAWVGRAGGRRLLLNITTEGVAGGEILVGFFKDPTWSQAPVQVRRVPGPGRHTIENLPPGRYQIGAMAGTLPTPSALGIQRRWPEPVEITAEATAEAEVLVSQADDGRFMLEGLPAEEVRIRALPFDAGAYDGRSGTVTVQLASGKLTEVRIQLTAKQTRYGRVIFEDGGPAVVSGFATSILMPMGGRALGAAEVQDDGIFELRLTEEELGRMESGEQRLVVNLAGIPTQTFPFELLSADKATAGVLKIPRPDTVRQP